MTTPQQNAPPGSETIVIRALFTNSDYLVKMANKLDVKDFSHKPYRIVYTAIKQLAASNTIISGDSIMALLQNKVPHYYSEIQQVGGVQWVNGLYDSAYETVVSLDEHINAVLDTSFNRRLYDVALEMYNLSQNNDITADEKLSKAQQNVYNLMLSTTKQRDTPKIGHSVFDTIERLIDGDESVRGISIEQYYPKFNNFVQRLQPGRLILVNAGAKIGKTSWTLDLAWTLAGRMGVPVAYADAEMSEAEMHIRLLSKLTGYSEKLLKNPEFSREHADILNKVGEYIFEAPLFRFRCVGMSEYEIETKVKLLQIQNGIKAFFWDYPKETGHEARLDKLLGNKIAVVKERIAEDCNIFCFAPMQRNPNTGKIADSNDPERYADAIIKFDKVTDDEQERTGNLLATHKLKIELARYLPDDGKTLYLNIDLDKQQIKEV